MANDVASILLAVSNDVRIVLSNTADSAIMIDWVNRVHKDVMHNTVYNSLLRTTASGDYAANTAQIANLTLSTPRRIFSVYDNIMKRNLVPLGGYALPGQGSSTAEGMAPVPAQAPGPNWPEFYIFTTTSAISVTPFPPLAATGGVLVTYEKLVTDLANTTDVLQVPTDGKDLMVHGVNALASAYLKRTTDAGYWQGIYESGKKTVPLV